MTDTPERELIGDLDRIIFGLLDNTSVIQTVARAKDTIEALLSRVDKLEERVREEISAWAFAHDIDGAIRNELFKRIHDALNRSAS